MVVALPELGALVLMLVALAICLMVRQFVLSILYLIAHFTRKVPLLDRLIGTGVHKLEQVVNQAFAAIVTGLEEGIAWTWHQLAHLVVRIGHEIAQAAESAAEITWYITVKYPIKVIHAATRKGAQSITIIQRVTKVVERRANAASHAIEHPNVGRIGAAIKAGTRGIDAGLERLDQWARARVKALEHSISVTLPHELAALRAGERHFGLTLRHLRAWLRRHERLLGAGALTAAVAYAIGRLGGGWICCTNWNRLGRSVCRLPSGAIDDLLALLVDVLVLTNICQVIPLLEAAFSEVATPVIAALTKAGAGICDVGHQDTPALATPPLYLPSAATLTLHLP